MIRDVLGNILNMEKYRYEFKEYNYILKDLLNEEDTLDDIRTGFLDSKPNEIEKKKLLKKEM